MQKPSVMQLFAALAGGLIAAAILLAVGFTRQRTTTTVVENVPTAGSVAQVGLSAHQIYVRDAPGVVYVSAKVVEKENSPFDLFPTEESGSQTGSGCVINANGTILTNAHVINGAVKISVEFANGDTVAAKVIGKDPDDDLALLKVNPSGQHLVPLPLGDSDTVEVGDPTVAIGNPFDLERTLTTGVVSALQREITAPNGFAIDNVIQTDAPINPGNSGGPLINAEGQVIGINSQIQTAEDGSDGSVGIGFAIPINTAKFVIPQLERTGKVTEGYLGVETVTISPSYASLHIGASSGALIESVAGGTPAAKAGLRGSSKTVTLADGITQVQIGGDIIVSVNGTPIPDADALESTITRDQPGQRVTVGIVRGTKHLDVTVTLGTRPESVPTSG